MMLTNDLRCIGSFHTSPVRLGRTLEFALGEFKIYIDNNDVETINYH